MIIGHYTICVLRMRRSTCTFAQPVQEIRCPLTNTLGTIEYIDEQRKSWSDCADRGIGVRYLKAFFPRCKPEIQMFKQLNNTALLSLKLSTDVFVLFSSSLISVYIWNGKPDDALSFTIRNFPKVAWLLTYSMTRSRSKHWLSVDMMCLKAKVRLISIKEIGLYIILSIVLLIVLL